jgi:hypothetical protein
MTKSLIALAFACVCGMLLVALPEDAQSQSVTITGCASPTFNTQTLTLTCGGGGSGPPVCSISGSPNGTTGIVDTLTANCSPAATSWSWTGGSCAGQTGQTCAANEASTGAVQYTVTGSNASGTGSASSQFTVTWFSTSGPPQGCAITPATQSLGSSGGAISQLKVTCAGGAPLTSFTWSATGGGCNLSFSPSSTNKQDDTLPSNPSTSSAAVCTYKAIVDNGSGSPQAPTATVTVAAKAGAAISCSDGASATPPSVSGVTGSTTNYNVPWVTDSGNSDYTGNGTLPPQKPGMAFVAKIQVPATAPMNPNAIGRIDIHEYIDTPHYRWMSVSSSPCSWSKTMDIYNQFQLGTNFQFTIGPNTQGLISLMPGQTYYVNIVMQNPAKTPPQGNMCGTTTCNMVLEFFKPNGT